MNPSTLVWICLWTFVTVPLRAQPPEALKSSPYSFELTRILMKDGTLKTGWFLGTYGDTLVAQIGNRSERISRSDLLRISIEATGSKSAPTLIGVLTGIYAGNALALKAIGQPFLFMERNDGAAPALYSALFGLVGGGIGYLVGAAQTSEKTFDFAGGEEANEEEWESLVGESSSRGQKGSVHFSINGSWVKGPLPRQGEHYSSGYLYNTEPASSLNMVRKIQLTYSLTNFLDVGLASVWLGQPSVGYSTYSNEGSVGATLSLEGNGLYAVAAFQPLWRLGGRKIQGDIGFGIGAASLDFKATPSTFWYANDPPPARETIEKKTTGVSTLLYGEVKLFLADYISLGVAADWVQVPGELSEVKGAALESTSLGTSSVGFVLGFHF